MALTKPSVLPPWADAGDKVQPTNAEIQTGWPLSNVPPSRQRFNWLLNWLMNGVRYLTRRGLPDYDAAETYMIGDRVIGDDGKTYRSIQDDNTNHAPSASPLWWEEWAPSLSRLADLLQKQTYTAFTTAGAAPNFTLTPAPAITAYTAGQRFRVKFHAAGNGANVLNISGLGNKSLKQYDSNGNKVAAAIAANQLADVEYDGVDMLLLGPLPSPGGYSGHSIVGTTTLTAANAGQVVACAGSATITLPAASSLKAGQSITFFATGASVVVQRAGADTIQPNGSTVTSITLNAGDTLVLESNGANAWGAIGGSGQLGYSDKFGSSLGANGYQKLPSGLILQWGAAATNSSGTAVVSFPIAFPNAVLSAGVVATNGGGVGTLAAAVQSTSLGVSGMSLWYQTATAGVTLYWFAIGK